MLKRINVKRLTFKKEFIHLFSRWLFLSRGALRKYVSSRTHAREGSGPQAELSLCADITFGFDLGVSVFRLRVWIKRYFVV